MKTVNLELSKQLKEAGYPQESVMWWVKPHKAKIYVCWHEIQLCDDEVKDWNYIASPTADEILEQLPTDTGIYKREDFYTVFIDKDNWGKYIHFNQGFSEPSIADAAAKMYIFLKENNLLEVKG